MQDFTDYLRSQDYRPISAKEYTRQAGLFLNWYAGEALNCQKKEVLAYLSYLKNKKNFKASSRSAALAGIRHYFEYLKAQQLITVNPAAFIKLRGVNRRRLHYTYNPEELTTLADSYYHEKVLPANAQLNQPSRPQLARNTYLAAMRDYCLLQCFIYQGISTGEALNLTVENVNLHKATLYIAAGETKGNARTLPLNAVQIGNLMQYLQQVRPQLARAETDTLFLPVAQSRRPAKNAAIALVKLSAYLKRADHNFHSLPQLRASVITYWIQTYGLRKAQYMAGHRSINSTEEYLPNVVEDLAEEISKFNPF